MSCTIINDAKLMVYFKVVCFEKKEANIKEYIGIYNT